MIRSVLEYAAEVWGGGDWKQAEQIQNKAGRILLGLSKNTSGEVPRGELGWLSLRARREFKQLLYWGKVLKMKDARLVKQVYQMRTTDRKSKGELLWVCEKNPPRS